MVNLALHLKSILQLKSRGYCYTPVGWFGEIKQTGAAIARIVRARREKKTDVLIEGLAAHIIIELTKLLIKRALIYIKRQ